MYTNYEHATSCLSMNIYNNTHVYCNTCFGYFKITDAKNDYHQHQTTHFTLSSGRYILSENPEFIYKPLNRREHILFA